MDLNVHVYLNVAELLGSSAHQKLDQIIRAVAALAAQEKTVMADLTALKAQVEETNTVERSAITLINGIAAQLAAAGTDPVALAALSDSLKSNSDALAAAVAANTPAAA